MTDAYRALGLWLFRHRIATLVTWAVVLALATPFARRAPLLLDAGSRQLDGTASAAVAAALAHDFSNPFGESLAVTFHSTTADTNDAAFKAAIDDLAEKLRAFPGVTRVLTPEQEIGPRLISEDRHDYAILVGLGTASAADAEKQVPAVRTLLASSLRGDALPNWEWHVTGRAAMVYDLNRYNAADSQRAELRALPLTLIVLLLVFGSLVSAALPLALGVAATLLALSVVPAVVQTVPLNILYQNIVTLLGLALGIDYSLFIVSRYREQRYKLADPASAMSATMATAGVAVTYSGLAVLIGLAGLLLTPIFELRSLGISGMIVVVACLLLALTLLPALLGVLDPWLDAPRKLSRVLRLKGSHSRWEKWTALVLRRPALALLLGLAVLLALSAPLLCLRPGFPDKPWLPASMGTTRGLSSLSRMGHAQELTPINLVVRASDGGQLFPTHIDSLFELSRRLHQDRRVARVFGPVDLGIKTTETELRDLYINLEQTLEDYPEIGEFVLSRDHTAALVQVVLTDGTGYEDSLACARELRSYSVPGISIVAGGHWPAMLDFDASLRVTYPLAFGAVGFATLIVLLAAFRSFLVPLKAIALNALSVSAAFGATVAVFQWGWGGSLLGLAEPTGAIPLTIPLIVFCVTFGLSMDYEVFILSRVREEFLRTHEGDESVRIGLITTGGLISGAAAIMVIVFGAFALADVLIVKMLGFGLAVAVAIDAAIVRVMMVPAAMKLAGRWNWFPGIR